jgi:integrase
MATLAGVKLAMTISKQSTVDELFESYPQLIDYITNLAADEGLDCGPGTVLDLHDPVLQERIHQLAEITGTNTKIRRQTFAEIKRVIGHASEGASESANTTVGEYLGEWVADNYPDPKTAEGRRRAGYEGYIRDYINPQLGDIPLAELTPHRTHRFVNWLKNEAKSPKTHKKLSQTTQAHVCACLSKALNDAVADELIPRSPLLVKVPLPKSYNTPEPYSKEELNALLAAKDITDYSLIATAALIGCRPSELLPRRWKDIDFNHGTLLITSSLECHTGEVKDTKTHQKRVVPLTNLNINILLEHQANSKFIKSDDLIWPNESGGFLDESEVSGRFSETLRERGFRHIRLYDLRHGHITELLNDNVPDKQIQHRVGHSSATMTKDRYGHFMVGAQEQSIRDWERKRFGKTTYFEPGASDRNRTYDKRFTKPLLYP